MLDRWEIFFLSLRLNCRKQKEHVEINVFFFYYVTQNQITAVKTTTTKKATC